MVKCDVLFEVRTGFLNIIYMSFGFKGLNRGFISLNNINQLIFVMVKCGVLFKVRTEFLNIIKISSDFKESKSVKYILLHICTHLCRFYIHFSY
jgi:hypothetical protein